MFAWYRSNFRLGASSLLWLCIRLDYTTRKFPTSHTSASSTWLLYRSENFNPVLHLETALRKRGRTTRFGMKYASLWTGSSRACADIHNYTINSLVFNKREVSPQTLYIRKSPCKRDTIVFSCFHSINRIHFRPLDDTLGNCSFEMSSHARAYVRINYEKTDGKFPWEYHLLRIEKTNKQTSKTTTSTTN